MQPEILTVKNSDCKAAAIDCMQGLDNRPHREYNSAN